jgi:hypothetical protein
MEGSMTGRCDERETRGKRNSIVLGLVVFYLLPFTLYPFWTGVRVKGNPYPVITR